MAGQTINLRPTILDLLIYAGDGFSIKIECEDNAGTPVDLSGYFSAQVRADRIHPEDSPLVSFIINTTDAYLGFIVLSMTGEQTASLLTSGEDKFTGVWDVEWTPAEMEPRTLLQGVVECVADVTR